MSNYKKNRPSSVVNDVKTEGEAFPRENEYISPEVSAPLPNEQFQNLLGLKPCLIELVCEIPAELFPQLMIRTAIQAGRYRNTASQGSVYLTIKDNQTSEIKATQYLLENATLKSLMEQQEKAFETLQASEFNLDKHKESLLFIFDKDSSKVDFSNYSEMLSHYIDNGEFGFYFVVKSVGLTSWLYIVSDSKDNENSWHSSFKENLAYFLSSEFIQLDEPLEKLNVVSPEQLKRQNENLIPANKTYNDLTIAERIESNAHSSPDNLAVEFEQEQLTYLELNNVANQIARHLISSGAHAGSKIGVILEPCPSIASVLLACLKANLTYVPIDPSFPEERQRFILEDTECEFIISHKNLAEHLSSNRLSVIDLDLVQQRLSKLDNNNLELAIDKSITAYIFYTSGTTGKPKGILANHHNLIQYINSAQDKYSINHKDVMGACARFSFSISLFELLFPLTHGATLKLFKRETILNVAEMVDQLTKLSFLHMGPSLLKLLLSHIKRNYSDLSAFKKLRHLSSGGDMIPSSLLKTARTLFPDIEIFVIYGSSEISCMGCTWEVPSVQEITKTFVGKPFPNTRLLLLDDNDMPTPSGAIGNLCFSGSGVINSYLNRPELNKEKFLNIKGEKYYRIGDRGRLSEDGNIELMGRADFQIQLHGLRIEPAEIEHYLKQNIQIKDAVVASRLNNSNEQILVAFVTLNNSTDLNRSELKLELSKFLPDYMLPAKFFVLEKLPLNHNFKVDRNALPHDIKQLDTEKKAGTTPISETEKQLANIWCEVLGIDNVYLEDNFLETGGDSLLSVAMMAKVKDEMDVELYGLDVARECLAVIASKIQGFNSVVDNFPSSASAKPVHNNHSFYFDEGRLYGVYHPAQNTSRDSAVLIVPPLGQEAVRINFLLKEVANALSDKGYACLRFDFFGTGNSLGEDQDTDFSIWKKNVLSALDKLSTLSGNKDVTILAPRLGANVAFEATRRYSVKLILLDPIVSGNVYYQTKSNMQEKVVSSLSFIKLFRQLPIHSSKTKQQEIVGFCPNNQLVKDIKGYRLDLNEFSKDTIRLLVSDSQPNLSINLDMLDNNSQLKSITTFLRQELDWDKFSMLENAITNQKLTNCLIKSVEEFKS